MQQNNGEPKRQQSTKADRTLQMLPQQKSGAGNHLKIQDKKLQQHPNYYFS
jgi:hypothetical protein